MEYGAVVPFNEEALPVYSVGDEEEARALIRLCCPMTLDGKYYARELAVEQTLENLEAFSQKLDAGHKLLKKAGTCRCKERCIRDEREELR